jgi:hypothetical protein
MGKGDGGFKFYVLGFKLKAERFCSLAIGFGSFNDFHSSCYVLCHNT